jgi:adenylate kinase
MDNIDTVIVLRCDPNVLKSRLEERSYSESKIKENLEAEAIGVIYSEALETVAKNRLFQLDTTDLEIRDSCKILKDFFDNKVKLDETIDYSERILEWY